MATVKSELCGGNDEIVALLERGEQALKDGDWANADSCFEDVLIRDPQNARAHLGKALAREKCGSVDELIRKRLEASQSVQGQKLCLEADDVHVDEMVRRYSLPGYVEQNQIRDLYTFDLSYDSDLAEWKRRYEAEETYWAAYEQLPGAELLENEKAVLFAALADQVKRAEAEDAAAREEVRDRYEDHLRQADQQVEALYKDAIARRQDHYKQLVYIAEKYRDIEKLTEAAEAFDRLGDYENSRTLAEHCRQRIAEEKVKREAEAEMRRGHARYNARAKGIYHIKMAILNIAVVAVAVGLTLLVNKVIIPNRVYKNAERCMARGEYERAIEIFEDLGDHKDSPERIAECVAILTEAKYNDAVSKMNKGSYATAYTYFTELNGYKDSTALGLECGYRYALELMEEGNYNRAIMRFEELDGYKDSAAMIEECERLLREEGDSKWVQ